MKIRRAFIVVSLVMILCISSFTLAGNTGNQIVTFQVTAINEIATSGNPGPLTVNSAVAGSQPSSAIDSTTTYAITTNESSKKITGVLDSVMPANTTLKINLAAPTGATSAGDVVLSDVAADLVTGISKVAESGKTITYTFAADIAAGIIPPTIRTVTLTVTD
ncbi:MAG: hypothetical protein K6U80_10000 [Firmicutes bacterium]|nr:hypothetical protein [Bacillota bacterium]